MKILIKHTVFFASFTSKEIYFAKKQKKYQKAIDKKKFFCYNIEC